MNERIRTNGNPTALWHELIRDAEQRAHSSLDETLESYLVFTLMRHQGDQQLAGRVMALELLEGLDCRGRRREDALRDVGDRCLLLAGLYPEQARERMVSLSYFVDLGRGSYDQLAAYLRAGLAELYQHLARSFAELVRVLVEVRMLSGVWQGLAPLDQYALCLSQGQLDLTRGQREFAGAVVLQTPEKVQ